MICRNGVVAMLAAVVMLVGIAGGATEYGRDSSGAKYLIASRFLATDGPIVTRMLNTAATDTLERGDVVGWSPDPIAAVDTVAVGASYDTMTLVSLPWITTGAVDSTLTPRSYPPFPNYDTAKASQWKLHVYFWRSGAGATDSAYVTVKYRSKTGEPVAAVTYLKVGTGNVDTCLAVYASRIETVYVYCTDAADSFALNVEPVNGVRAVADLLDTCSNSYSYAGVAREQILPRRRGLIQLSGPAVVKIDATTTDIANGHWISPSATINYADASESLPPVPIGHITAYSQANALQKCQLVPPNFGMSMFGGGWWLFFWMLEADADIDTAEAGIDSLQAEVDSVKVDVVTAEAGIDSLQAEADSVAAGLDSAQAEIDSVKVDVVTAEAGIDSLQAEVDSVKVDVVTAEAGIDSLQAGLDSAQAEIDTARAEVNDTADILRAEMPDSADAAASVLAGDTADILRAEMPDSADAAASVLAGDTADILRAEMPDSADAAASAIAGDSADILRAEMQDSSAAAGAIEAAKLVLWRNTFRAGQFDMAPDSAPSYHQRDSTHFSWDALAFDQTVQEQAYILDCMEGYTLADTADSVHVLVAWSANSASTDSVKWLIAFNGRADAQLFDSTLDDGGFVADANTGQGDLNIIEGNFAVTTSSVDEIVSFAIRRDVTVAANLAADADLILVRFSYFKP